MRKLAKYISLVADGNEAIILSSGFGVRNKSEPMPPISRPVDFSVQRGERQGEVKLRWKTVRGGMSYLVDMTTTDPADTSTQWTKITTTVQSNHTVDNLNPGTYYWFRMCAVGRKETSAHSNVELIMAA